MQGPKQQSGKFFSLWDSTSQSGWLRYPLGVPFIPTHETRSTIADRISFKAMEAPPHDFASLAIIVTDWDSLYTKEIGSPSTTSPKMRSSPTIPSMEQSSETGISDIVDEIWNLMSSTLRSKLREACIGVLRRTDNVDANEGCYWLDDDARLLD